MEDYDKAWSEHQNKLDLIPLPITSWDFHELDLSEESLLKKIQKKWDDQSDFLEIAKAENKEIIITDRRFTIIFASENIKKINGYNRIEIIGKSPKMFQGKDTSVESRDNIQKAIRDQKPFKEIIVNYSKNGEKYLCEIEAYPKFSKDGEFLNYIAFEKVA